MDRLWTPWRYQYVSDESGPECIFCELITQPPQADAENFVLSRREHTFLILNKYPYTSGHLMVVLNRHIPNLQNTNLSELQELIEAARETEGILQQVYRSDGFNIGFNIGKSAGAGVAGHLHLHVVPRWTGDSNFVSVIGETRVIPEDLNTTYERLHPLF